MHSYPPFFTDDVCLIIELLNLFFKVGLPAGFIFAHQRLQQSFHPATSTQKSDALYTHDEVRPSLDVIKKIITKSKTTFEAGRIF